LKAAAAAAISQMPMVAAAMAPHCAELGHPGTAKAMPITAQNTMSWTTLGLVNA
jgi:hypothetical protein